MSGIELLEEMVRQVRDHTVQLLRGTPQTWLTWSPPGTQNHILWHAGHALWVQDALCVEPLTGSSELPTGWEAIFGMQCRPPLETREWPSSHAVCNALLEQRARLLELLGQIPDTSLQLLPQPPHGWDLVRGMIHGLHDEARHSGEMYLLFKLCRVRHEAR